MNVLQVVDHECTMHITDDFILQQKSNDVNIISPIDNRRSAADGHDLRRHGSLVDINTTLHVSSGDVTCSGIYLLAAGSVAFANA